MSHSHYKTKPRSRKDLRMFAYILRQALGYSDLARLDIVRVLEHDLVKVFGDDFEYEVVEVDEMEEYAICLPDLCKIIIREDVYVEAAKGYVRHRFTIAHEIGHLFLHHDVKKLARIGGKLPDLKVFENPEWQANEFAGEFLAPSHLIGNLSVEEIATTFNVSKQVAIKRYNNVRK
ncbi:ImmA/IrrE family metallo-endopeptidase [Exiguobacterium sp. s142]|uniref:ImmA/IrrE family metallo-endopeptidase n=1 Tax=Exiguobacterium sp. s142 TaxID=2751222 RepID=UPI001BE7862E|nr:ImmA/IrrE family metallo-endopeptidase [Exiguobacterium sp. s142]